MNKLKVLDLFSGIGGFSLGLERTGGFETVAFCEIEPYPRAVLKRHWPQVPCYDDVRTLTADTLRRDGIGVDVICGGFPCQDISFAGNQAGMDGTRSGLWSEIARLTSELRPKYIIVENVSALLSGPSERPGGWFGRVLGDLARMGFSVGWGVVRTAEIGADHERARVWIVAHADKTRLSRRVQTRPDAAHVENIITRLRSAVMASRDFPSEHWSHQPVLGGGIHGLPHWLDGGLNESKANRPFEALRMVRRSDVEKAVQHWPLGRHGSIQAAEVLRHGMPTAGSGKALRHTQADDDVEGEEAQNIGMSSVSGRGPIARPPHGQEPLEQLSEQFDDALRHLPQPPSRRASRIAALGNAVVPQIPELIGRAILQAEGLTP